MKCWERVMHHMQPEPKPWQSESQGHALQAARTKKDINKRTKARAEQKPGQNKSQDGVRKEGEKDRCKMGHERRKVDGCRRKQLQA
jgi:hypothetical protein